MLGRLTVLHIMGGRQLRRNNTNDGQLGAFTLIELLVVVAIIGLLVSILLPSLGRARAQSRTTLCASRIGTMTKAMFVYGDDNAELLPFHIVYGIEPAWGGGGNGGPNDFDPNEDWLASKSQMPKVFLSNQDDWPMLGVDLPRSGSLYTYTRFPEVYACPEFVRRPDNGAASVSFYAGSTGDQRAFNYTRGPWCRRPKFALQPTYTLEFSGPIMTPSKVYAPSQAILLIDESWYSHVGRGRPYEPGHYWACDPVWDVSSCAGIYHGAPISGEAYFRTTLPNYRQNIPLKQASISAYDGHVELYRDPCPVVDANMARFTVQLMVSSKKLIDMLNGMVYSLIGQRPVI